MISAIERPIALQREYLPPTQSQKTNIFERAIPNFTTSVSFVDNATKCLAICAGSKADFKNHPRAEWGLVMVSCVVNVFEAIRKRVSSGFIFLSVSTICVASTL